MTVVLSRGQYVQVAAQAEQYGSLPLRYVPDLLPLLTGEVDRTGMAWSLADPEAVYRNQPAVRMVVDYLTGRGAIVPFCAYTGEDPRSRERLLPSGSPVAQVLEEPMPGVAFCRWLFELLSDVLLWDRWLLLPSAVVNARGEQQLGLARLAPWAWHWGNADGSDRSHSVVTVLGEYEVQWPNFIADSGRGDGTSITWTMRDLIQDMWEATQYRQQVWRSGGRISGVVERPPEPPGQEWSDTARKRFLSEWKTLWQGGGPEAGGTPVLEDGMQFRSLQAFNAVDLQWAQGREMSLIEACIAWHVAPELVGARPATFANQKEHRKAVYQETLGPILEPIAGALQMQWARLIEEAYIQPDTDKLLAGTLDEEFAALQTATGRPWQTLNETRVSRGLAPLPDGDYVIVPMNVTEGGLASPNDTSPTASRGGEPPAVQPAYAKEYLVLPPGRPRVVRPSYGQKAAVRPAAYTRLAAAMARDIAAVVGQQRRDVLRQLGTKEVAGPVDWDQQQWERLLAAALLPHTTNIASVAAHGVVAAHDPSYPWDDEPMAAYLQTQAARIGSSIAASTGRQVVEALALGEAALPTITALFDHAAGAGAQRQATGITTEAAGFGGHDAAMALGLGGKQWQVTSANPRESHAAIDGEVVPLGQAFSNGARYPGDHTLDIAERAGCTCTANYTAEA